VTSRESKCIAVPNLVGIRGIIVGIWRFFIFPRWRSSAILDLLCGWLDHRWRSFGGLYHCAKFGWNQCSSFDNMQVLAFWTLAGKCLFTPLFLGGRFWGHIPPKNVTHRLNPEKDCPWVEPRHLSHKSWILAVVRAGCVKKKKKDRIGKSHKRVIFHLFVDKPPLKRSA